MRGHCRTSAHGVITDPTRRRVGSLVSCFQEQLFHIFWKGWECVVTWWHPVIEQYSMLHMDHLPIQAAVGLSLLHVGLWAKLFVSLARISMLSLPAELPKYCFISNERSALAMQRIHKGQDSGLGKTPKRGGGKGLVLSSLSWRIIIILLSFPSCPPACSGRDCIVHTKLPA